MIIPTKMIAMATAVMIIPTKMNIVTMTLIMGIPGLGAGMIAAAAMITPAAVVLIVGVTAIIPVAVAVMIKTHHQVGESV